MKRPEDDKIKKLPKWAQQYIQSLEYSYKSAISVVKMDWSDDPTEFCISRYISNMEDGMRAKYLPLGHCDSLIVGNVEAGSNVHHKGMYVNSHRNAHSLILNPVSSNVVTIIGDEK